MEGNKKSKKKVLLYYLILAACLLIIAAVTVTVVLTVGRNNQQLAEKPGTQQPDDTNKPGDTTDPNKPGDTTDPNKPDDSDPNKPANTDDKYALPLNTASVTCGYEFAFDKTLDRYAVHQGMDFEGKAGDNVYAVLDGTVTKIVTDHILNENYVTITHKDGVTSTYKYIDAKEGLKEGATVKKGDVIGTIAAAGGMELKEGEHLHLEMRANGKTVDPDTYLEITEK